MVLTVNIWIFMLKWVPTPSSRLEIRWLTNIKSESGEKLIRWLSLPIMPIKVSRLVLHKYADTIVFKSSDLQPRGKDRDPHRTHLSMKTQIFKFFVSIDTKKHLLVKTAIRDIMFYQNINRWTKRLVLDQIWLHIWIQRGRISIKRHVIWFYRKVDF